MKLSHLLPEPLRRRLRSIWWGYLRWPKPFWQIAGYGSLDIAGERFRFYDLAEPIHEWWAWRAWRREWEPEVLEFFAESVRPGDVVLDIGAYTGAYSLLASRLIGPDGRVYAFEPDPVARSVLERNIRANGALNVEVLPVAITDHDGTAMLAVHSLGDATSAVSDSETPGSLQVEASTLRSFCERRAVAPAVIKIDVEGGEAGVLIDDARAIVQATRAIILELHERPLAALGVDAASLLARLEGWGGRIVELERREEFEGNYNVAVVPA
jgi:FkbM family methyltransferase